MTLSCLHAWLGGVLTRRVPLFSPASCSLPHAEVTSPLSSPRTGDDPWSSDRESKWKEATLAGWRPSSIHALRFPVREATIRGQEWSLE